MNVNSQYFIMLSVFFVQLGLLFISAAAATVVSRQVQLGKYEYFVPPTPAWNLRSWNTTTGKNRGDLVPITVLSFNGTADSEAVKRILNTYETSDDVWTSSFTEGKSSSQIYMRARCLAKLLKSSLYPILASSRGNKFAEAIET